MNQLIPCLTVLLLCLTGTSCNNKSEHRSSSQYVEMNSFQEILATHGIAGSILIYDPKDDVYYSNDFEWSKTGKLPASTFKIPNTLIALETGIVKSDSSILTWDGESRAMEIWERDLTLRQAFHFSCVPCYQDIARQIGAERMSYYMEDMRYGSMDINDASIHNFWLVGKSSIDQFQQIAFLKDLFNKTLPLNPLNQELMKKIMVIEESSLGRLSGKTGWSIDGDNHNAWFVGYLERPDRTYFFATNISPLGDREVTDFPHMRKTITVEGLEMLLSIHGD